jgi:hypothetical protein
MTNYDDIGEIELDEALDTDRNLFDAVCEDCGTVDRFNIPGEKELGERFGHYCRSCNSARFPNLGEPTRLRVVNISPNRDTYPNEPSSRPVFTTNESK